MCFTLQKYRPENLGWSLCSELQVSPHLWGSFNRCWWHIFPLSPPAVNRLKPGMGRLSMGVLILPSYWWSLLSSWVLRHRIYQAQKTGMSKVWNGKKETYLKLMGSLEILKKPTNKQKPRFSGLRLNQNLWIRDQGCELEQGITMTDSWPFLDTSIVC